MFTTTHVISSWLSLVEQGVFKRRLISDFRNPDDRTGSEMRQLGKSRSSWCDFGVRTPRPHHSDINPEKPSGDERTLSHRDRPERPLHSQPVDNLFLPCIVSTMHGPRLG